MKAVIFDLDGVLVDSQPIHYKVDALALKRFGIDAGQDTIEKFAGVQNSDRFKEYKAIFKLSQSVDELVAAQVSIMDDYIEHNELKPISYVRETLTALKQNHLLAVASSSSVPFIDTVLRKLGIINFFDIIVSGETVQNGKPAPDIFLKAAELLNTPTYECVVVEDAHKGVKAANNAGIKVIGYRNESSGKQDLSTADAVFDRFEDILEYILIH